MIWFGEGWTVEDGRIVHACSPDVRVFVDQRPACDCGATLPRSLRLFQDWLSEENQRSNAQTIGPPTSD